MENIQDEFRMIISHALLGSDISDVDKETWDLVMRECEKFSVKLAKEKCKEQRELCSHALTADIPKSPTHNLVLFAPEPSFNKH